MSEIIGLEEELFFLFEFLFRNGIESNTDLNNNFVADNNYKTDWLVKILCR